MKIAFIGGGNMGEAMLLAVLDKGLASREAICVSDVNQARRELIQQRYGVATTDSNRQAVHGADVVVLAIKPQNLADVMAELNGQLKPRQLVLSIIAGARLATLCAGLDHGAVVRVMPNTPAQIGEGMSVWTAASEVAPGQKEQVASILGAMGREVFVDDEKYIDMATAVSGSGPAYVFLFMESLVEAAVHIGLPRDMAREMVMQTVIGSARFAGKSGKPLAELRKMVTSPGGTTAEALLRLEKGDFSGLVKQAVIAAHDKARKLGGSGD
ncbi:MAG: pyrroline-5-carboxylate reductase [Chloroflexi bacterium]|nr:pyrroline-5-carboxylate reductase [Chloroflexota bacterium]